MREGFIQKRCPKCGGNIYLDRDYYGWFEKCLQCSHTSYLETVVEVGDKVGKASPGDAKGSAQGGQNN